jgi:HPt (histidine-containing phosphotransfer) domain-containing protein
MDDYLTKPLRPNELFEVLARIKPRAQRKESPASGTGAVSARTGGRASDKPPAKSEVSEDKSSVTAGQSSAPPVVVADSADAGVAISALVELADSMGGDNDAVKEMVGAFLEMAPALIEDIKTAFAKRDAATLRTAAHTLKPNAQMFGAKKLHEVCVALEARGKAADFDAAAPLVTQVAALGERALRELRAWSEGAQEVRS